MFSGSHQLLMVASNPKFYFNDIHKAGLSKIYYFKSFENGIPQNYS